MRIAQGKSVFKDLGSIYSYRDHVPRLYPILFLKQAWLFITLLIQTDRRQHSLAYRTGFKGSQNNTSAPRSTPKHPTRYLHYQRRQGAPKQYIGTPHNPEAPLLVPYHQGRQGASKQNIGTQQHPKTPHSVPHHQRRQGASKQGMYQQGDKSLYVITGMSKQRSLETRSFTREQEKESTLQGAKVSQNEARETICRNFWNFIRDTMFSSISVVTSDNRLVTPFVFHPSCEKKQMNVCDCAHEK